MAKSDFHYNGFADPNYTPVPDDVFDLIAPNLTESELRVLLYVVRRTFGFRKTSDAISVSQMERGITTREGTVLDLGTGLSRTAIRTGCRGLIDKGILTVDRVLSPDGDYETNVYSLCFATPGVGQQMTHPGSASDRGVGQQVTPQETVVQETEEQETAFEIRNSNGTDPNKKTRRTLEELAAAEEEWQTLQARIKRLRGE